MLSDRRLQEGGDAEERGEDRDRVPEADDHLGRLLVDVRGGPRPGEEVEVAVGGRETHRGLAVAEGAVVLVGSRVRMVHVIPPELLYCVVNCVRDVVTANCFSPATPADCAAWCAGRAAANGRERVPAAGRS